MYTRLSASMLVALAGYVAVGCVAETGLEDEHVGESTAALGALTVAFVQSEYLQWGGAVQASSYRSYNPTGAKNTLTYLGLGKYRVDFPGLSSAASSGNALVSAVGKSNERCNIDHWGPSGSNLQVFVDCWGTNGAAKDATFSLSFQRRTDTPGPDGAYLWANNPTLSSYTLSTAYQWSSTGGSMTIQRRSKGDYNVTLAGQDLSRGTVQVSAYGATNAYCKVNGWNAGGIRVACFDGSTALATDARFTLVFATNSPSGLGTYGYAWVNSPPSGIPDLQWQRSVMASQCGGSVTLPDVYVTRPDDFYPNAGRYNVFMRGLYNALPPGTFQVTAYGGGPEACEFAGSPFGSAVGGVNAVELEVRCFAPNGSLVDTPFTVTYSWLQSLVC